MKKIIFYVLSLTAMAFGQTYAQTAQQHLNSAIQSEGNIRTGVVNSKEAVNQLVKEIAVIGNPNAVLFNNKMFEQINTVQNNVDDTDHFLNEAKSVSAIPFTTQAINTLTADLINLNDELIGLTYQIDELLNSNNNNAALNLLPQVKNVLDAQDSKAVEVINAIQTLKQTIKVYNVCLQTVDHLGNPVYDAELRGFWAQNQTTGEYIYPENQDGNCFENLSAGYYRFDARHGYWSGVAPEYVTLSENLENEDGIIIINLVYWVE